MDCKERFLKIYHEKIHRQGAEDLLAWLERSDFFTAPASTKFHLACEGGLCTHSLHVYDRLVSLRSDEETRRKCFPESATAEDIDESIALVALLHDLCKVNCYKPGTRNVKQPDGSWQQVPTYSFEDSVPYGHGEKSVYVISGFLKLKRYETFAIRWHMGFSDNDFKGGGYTVGNAFERFPLAVLAHIADLEATYLDE